MINFNKKIAKKQSKKDIEIQCGSIILIILAIASWITLLFDPYDDTIFKIDISNISLMETYKFTKSIDYYDTFDYNFEIPDRTDVSALKSVIRSDDASLKIVLREENSVDFEQLTTFNPFALINFKNINLRKYQDDKPTREELVDNVIAKSEIIHYDDARINFDTSLSVSLFEYLDRTNNEDKDKIFFQFWILIDYNIVKGEQMPNFDVDYTINLGSVVKFK